METTPTSNKPCRSAHRPRWLSLLLAILLACSLCGTLHAQDAEASLPDPLRLTADWWHYFDVEPETLATRAGEFEKHLLQLQNQLHPDQAQATQSTVDEILQALARYLRLKGRQPGTRLPETPFAINYKLAELLTLAAQTRDATLELSLEQDDSARQNESLKRARQHHDNLKAAYLKLDAEDPARLSSGLNVILTRLNISLVEQELRLHQPRIQQLIKSSSRLQLAADAAIERLTAEPADLEGYREQATRAHDEVETLRNEAAFARLRGSGDGNSDVDRARARRHTQRLLEFEVLIADASLRADGAELSVTLLNYLLDDGERDVATAAFRQQLEQFKESNDTFSSRLRNWRQATDRERSAAAGKLALDAGLDATLAQAQRARLTQADATLQALAKLQDRIALSETLREVAARQLAEGSGRFAAWFSNLKTSAGRMGQTVLGWSSASLFSINETPVTLAGLLRVIVIVTIAWWISKLLRRTLQRASSKRPAMNRASLYTLTRLFHYAILATGFVVGLSSIGIDFTKFALLISALGVGLGFGLQAIFSNFVAGLIILFEKSLKVGDFVDLQSGVTGEVREINIRNTLITTNDNIDILVPNSEFVNGRVTNWTHQDGYRRVHIPFGVAYGTNKEFVRKVVLEASMDVPYTLKGHMKPEPQVWLVGFGDSALNFELVLWLSPDAVKRPATVNAAYCWAIETALTENEIEIPFPQRDLHVRSVTADARGKDKELVEATGIKAALAGDGATGS